MGNYPRVDNLKECFSVLPYFSVTTDTFGQFFLVKMFTLTFKTQYSPGFPPFLGTPPGFSLQVYLLTWPLSIQDSILGLLHSFMHSFNKNLFIDDSLIFIFTLGLDSPIQITISHFTPPKCLKGTCNSTCTKPNF